MLTTQLSIEQLDRNCFNYLVNLIHRIMYACKITFSKNISPIPRRVKTSGLRVKNSMFDDSKLN